MTGARPTEASAFAGEQVSPREGGDLRQYRTRPTEAPAFAGAHGVFNG